MHSILQHLLLQPKVQKEQLAQRNGIPALLSSKFLSLQALCNPRLPPWPSPHRGAAYQWEESPLLPTHHFTLSTVTSCHSRQAQTLTCLPCLASALPHGKEPASSRKALTKAGQALCGCPAPPAAGAAGRMEEPLGALPLGLAGKGSARRDAVKFTKLSSTGSTSHRDCRVASTLWLD